MPQEFHVESFLSSKQLNHQSVSLVIPRIARERIHNVMYYKVNLNTVALRGDTVTNLSRVLIRDLGTIKNKSINQVHLLGGVEFKCLLMKMVEMCPTWDQLKVMMKNDTIKNFDNKYIVALILTYLRIQYSYLNKDAVLGKKIKSIFAEKLNNYRKLKSISMDIDCWSTSQRAEVEIIHMDELVEWLTTKDNIWGIPLGKCQWCNLLDEDETSSESDIDSDSSCVSDNN